MNEKEVGMLLADVARRDGRQPSAAMHAMWCDALDDIDYREAREALRLLNKETSDYLTPAHIRQSVRRVRVARKRQSVGDLERRQSAIAACGLCDERGYRLPAGRMLCDHSRRREVGAARAVRAALEGGENVAGAAVGARSGVRGLSVPEATK